MRGMLSLVALSLPFLLLAQSNESTQSFQTKEGPGAAEEDGVQWSSGLSWEQVKQKAKDENKFIFVDAYATWCGPCKKMDKEVYPDKTVGEVVNQKFISVKLQMDQTPKDNEETKRWYPVVKEFNSQYSIDGFPSLLFFDADGKLVHKAMGFVDVPSFIDLAKDALTDPEERFEKSVAKFKNGQLDYTLMPDLITQALSKRDEKLGTEIATVYKEKYLDKLNDSDAFKKTNLKLLTRLCGYLINSKDRYFNLFYNQPRLADSIMGDKVSRQVTLLVIKKEDIYDKIYDKDGKPITSVKPQWERYERSIRMKYGEKYLEEVSIPDRKIVFYEAANDWDNYVKCVNEKIIKTPPQVNGKAFGVWGDAWTLNQYAWQLFLYCNDKKYFEKALPWTDLAIKLDTTAANDDYYDTKANLLYRMGKVKQAIELEEFAVARSNDSDKAVADNLRKMKAGLPTWEVPKEEKNQN